MHSCCIVEELFSDSTIALQRIDHLDSLTISHPRPASSPALFFTPHSPAAGTFTCTPGRCHPLRGRRLHRRTGPCSPPVTRPGQCPHWAPGRCTSLCGRRLRRRTPLCGRRLRRRTSSAAGAFTGAAGRARPPTRMPPSPGLPSLLVVSRFVTRHSTAARLVTI